VSPRTLPGGCHQAQQRPQPRSDPSAGVPAVPAPSGRDQRGGEGAQQHPPLSFPQDVISAAGASAGLTNTPQVPFASTFSPPSPQPLKPQLRAPLPPPPDLTPPAPRDEPCIHESLLPASVLTRAVNRGRFSAGCGASGSAHGPGHQAPALQGRLLTWRSSG